MRGPTGSISGVAAGVDVPANTAPGGGGRGRRSKQAPRRAAVYRQMTRIINEHNAQTQHQHARSSIRGKHNNILEFTMERTQAIGMLGGSQEEKDWMRQCLASNFPDQPESYIASVTDNWEMPYRKMDQDMLWREEQALSTTLQRWYVPRYGNMEEDREEGVFCIMGGQQTSDSGSSRISRELFRRGIFKAAALAKWG